jgi:small subunit ribosomal protein S20
MPVIKSAIKKLRQDRVREARNDNYRKELRDILRAVKKPTAKFSTLQDAHSIIDKGVKKNLMHANKAARMKSQVAKLVTPSKPSTKKASATA